MLFRLDEHPCCLPWLSSCVVYCMLAKSSRDVEVGRAPVLFVLVTLLCCLCWPRALVLCKMDELLCCSGFMSSSIVYFFGYFLLSFKLDKSGLYGLSNVTKM